MREPSSSGAPSPAGAARLGAPRALRAMAGARPPPGLLPLLAPLLLPLLLPAGCRALEDSHGHEMGDVRAGMDISSREWGKTSRSSILNIGSCYAFSLHPDLVCFCP